MMALQLGRLIGVLALLIVAALLATPPGRLPLALRGVYRILCHDQGFSSECAVAPAPRWKRLAAFFLVLVAAVLAIW